jgi:hypothetical protein
MCKEVVFVHAMKLLKGRRGTAPFILNIGTGWIPSSADVRGRIPWKALVCPLNRRLGGPHRLSGRFGEAKIIFPLSEFEARTFQP